MIHINKTKEILDKLEKEDKISILEIDIDSFSKRMTEIKNDYLEKEAKTIIEASKTLPFKN